ncbi:MAG: hypothetical protein IJC07_00280 [Clostridia bacterium]|nr:hypothetical protein [Clostridia bacterium]
MKLTKKIKAIFVFAILAILALTCAACGKDSGSTSNVPFKWTKDVPTTVLYSNEIYFRDYLPREYWQDYELYVSYYDVEEGKQVTDEKCDNLVFTFNQVTEYSFTIKRGGDSLSCKIAGVPEVPQLREVTFKNIRLGRTMEVKELAAECFGVNELKNGTLAKSDKTYKIEPINIAVESVEVNGTDNDNLSFNKNGTITFDQEAFYVITFRASNISGYDDQKVTFSTADSKKHNSDLNGYILENGEGVEDNELHFYMPLITEELKALPDDTKINVRFGKSAENQKYEATYNKAKDDIVVMNFPHQIGISEKQRVFFEVGGANYSTFVTTAQIVNNANKADLFNRGGGYVLVTEDIDYSDFTFQNVGNDFVNGVIDGDGHTISNLTKISSVINAKGATINTGFSFAKTFSNSSVKDIVIDNITAGGGVISGAETIGKVRIENVLVRYNATKLCASAMDDNGTANPRTSLLGYHKEYTEWATLKNVIVEMPYGINQYVGMISTHCGGKQIFENVYLVGGHGSAHSPIGNAAHYPVSYYTKDSKMNVTEGVDYFVSTVGDKIYKNFKANDSTSVPEWLFDKTLELGMINEITTDNFEKLLTATAGYFVLGEDIDFTKVDINGDGVVDANDTWHRASVVTFGGMLDGFGHKIINFTPGTANDDSLFCRGNNAIVRDLYFHATGTRTGVRNGTLFGQANTNPITISNCVIVLDELTNNQDSAVVPIIQSKVMMNDCVVIVNGKGGEQLGNVANGFVATTAAATKGAYIDNVYFIDTTNTMRVISPVRDGFYETGVYGADELVAVEDEDYFMGTSILSFNRSNFDGMLADWYDDLAAEFAKRADYVEINKDNVTTLASATAGYYVLTEDIDMKDITWDATAEFAGTLNGNGHKLYNINTTTGLFKSTNNAVIENIELQFAEASTVGVIGTVTKETKVRNAVVTMDKAVSAAIAKEAKGALIVRQTLIDVKAADDTAKYIVAGGSGAVALTDVSVVDEKFGTITEAGEYDLYKDIFDIYVEELPTAFLKEVYTANTAATIRPHTIITKENINVLMSATEGYFILGEDIDLSKVEWTASKFNGTLNGKGFKISGIKTALFDELTGMVRNVELYAANVESGKAILANTIAGDTTLVDVAIKADQTASNLIASTVNGAVILDEVFVDAQNIELAEGVALLIGAGAGSVAAEAVYVITPDTETALYATTTITGEAKVYKDVVAFVDADRNGEITINKDIMNATDDLAVRNELNASTVKAFMKSTGGYWYLSDNLDLTGTGFKTIANFNGTLDGCGYAITNLMAPLFTEFSGTLRNVAISTNKAVITNVNDALVSDVVVTYATLSAPIFTTVKGDLVINEVVINSATYALGNKNVVYNKLADDASVKVEGLYVVAFADAINVGDILGVDGEAAVIEEDYFHFDSVEALIHADSDETITLTDYLIQELHNSKVAIRITQENLESLLTADGGYWYLAEDVDATRIVWKSSAHFKGTFDGLGHKLTGLNFSTTPTFNGLFSYLDGGAVKNVYLGYTNLTAAHQACIAARMEKEAVLVENVVIDVDNYSSWGGGIITKVLPASVELTVRNVFVNIDVFTHSAGDMNRGVLVGGDTSRAEVTLDNVIVIADIEGAELAADEKAKADAEKKGETYTGKAKIHFAIGGVTEGSTYNVYKNVVEYVDATLAEENPLVVDEFIAKGVAALSIAVAVDSAESLANIKLATGGYWYLTNDIDMKDVVWANPATATFTGTLNGNGYKITNLALNTKDKYDNFIYTLDGATVKNFYLHITEANNAQTAPFGIIRGKNNRPTVFENVIIMIDSQNGVNAGGISYHNEGANTTLNNVMVVIGGEKASGNQGLLFGSYSVDILVKDVYIVDMNAKVEKIIGSTDRYNTQLLTLAGEAAVVGKDYTVITDVFGFDKSKLPTEAMKEVIENCKSKIDVTELTAENFVEEMSKATEGYYSLTADIDLTGVAWAPTTTFAGTLFGNGHKITGLNTNLFKNLNGASISDLYIHSTVANATTGAISYTASGNVSIRNVVVDIDTLEGSNAGGLLRKTEAGSVVTLENVLINIDARSFPMKNTCGYIVGQAGGTVVVKNVFTINATGREFKALKSGTLVNVNGETPVIGTDYVEVTSAAALDSTTLTTDFLKAGYNALYPTTEA